MGTGKRYIQSIQEHQTTEDIGAKEMVERLVSKQSLMGRRSSILQEEKYWAYRTGIELTPWSTSKERKLFEQRKRELQEQDAKEKGEVKQASTPLEEATDGKHQDHRAHRQHYPYAERLLQRKNSRAAGSKDRTDKPVQLQVQLLRDGPESTSEEGHGQGTVQEGCEGVEGSGG
jgi:hypothetical protein